MNLVVFNIILLIFSILFLGSAYLCFSQNGLVCFKDWLLFKKSSTFVLFGLSSVIFLYRVATLSVADFGNHKHFLFLAFASICILSLLKVRDLLSIRGFAIMVLFLCEAVLGRIYFEVFFMHGPFVTIVYGTIILSITIGAAPYLFRDAIDKLMQSRNLRKLFGVVSICAALSPTLAIFSK